MITQFDPYAIIKKLAEAVLSDGSVPFGSLRVPQCTTVGPHYHHAVHYHPARGNFYAGWYPEPDVEKACWRIAKVLADDVHDKSEAQHLVDNLADDSILLVAEVWLDEKETL